MDSDVFACLNRGKGPFNRECSNSNIRRLEPYVTEEIKLATIARKPLLDGYKVIDFTQYVAGPTVTKLMAELGAEIIKVELAPEGDLSRKFPYMRDQRSAYFVQQDRGKMSLCVDIKTAAGKAIVGDLIPKVDVLGAELCAWCNWANGLRLRKCQQAQSKDYHVLGLDFRPNGPLSPEPGYDLSGSPMPV